MKVASDRQETMSNVVCIPTQEHGNEKTSNEKPMINKTFTREKKDGEAILKIKSAISVYEAADIRNELVTCFKNHDRVILNIDEATGCDTAGIQLMLSASRTARDTGKAFEVRGTSDSVRKSIVDLGLRISDLFCNLQSEIKN